MKLEEIMALWEKDSVLDKTEISSAAINITRLHEKYLKIFTIEKMLHTKVSKEFKVLWRDKYEFYTQGPSQETQAKGWVMPAKGRIVKQEVDIYMDADTDIIDMQLRLDLLKAKMEYLESVMKILHNMNYHLRVSVDWEKFIGGA